MLLFIDERSWFCQNAMYWIFAKTVELLGTCKSHHHWNTRDWPLGSESSWYHCVFLGKASFSLVVDLSKTINDHWTCKLHKKPYIWANRIWSMPLYLQLSFVVVSKMVWCSSNLTFEVSHLRFYSKNIWQGGWRTHWIGNSWGSS